MQADAVDAHATALRAFDDHAHVTECLQGRQSIFAFKEAGDPFDPQVAERLRRHVYASGNSMEPGAAYAAFRGRGPKVEPLLRKRGLLVTVD